MLLRPDFVKLDRSITRDVDHDIGKEALCEAVGTMAGRLDGTVVAEGIETTNELDVLLRLGIPMGQGYLCGRPTAEPAPVRRSLSNYLAYAGDTSPDMKSA